MHDVGYDTRTATDGMPASMALSVPWNHDPELLDRLEPFAHRVDNLYLPFHPSISGSFRVWSGPESAAAYRDQVDRVATWAAARDVNIVLVANLMEGLVDGDGLVEEVRRVAPNAPRLRLAFVDAVVAARLQDRIRPHADIGVSVMAHVMNAVQAMYWKEVTGASFVTVAREISRRPVPLEDIRSLGFGIGVVTCDECIPFCPFYSHHLSPTSPRRFTVGGCSPESVGFLASRPWLIAQKEVLPGHLRHLDGLVDEVKIPGRDQPTDTLIRLVEFYLEGTSLVHPMGYYEEPPDAWEVLARCDRRCHACRYCADTIHRRKVEAETMSSKLGARDVPPDDVVVPGDGPTGPPGSREVPWRFQDAAGRGAEVWLEPAGDHHALREVQGLAVYYRCPAGDIPGVAELVVAVGDALEAALPESLSDGGVAPGFTLPVDGWPGGIVLMQDDVNSVST